MCFLQGAGGAEAHMQVSKVVAPLEQTLLYTYDLSPDIHESSYNLLPPDISTVWGVDKWHLCGLTIGKIIIKRVWGMYMEETRMIRSVPYLWSGCDRTLHKSCMFSVRISILVTFNFLSYVARWALNNYDCSWAALLLIKWGVPFCYLLNLGCLQVSFTALLYTWHACGALGPKHQYGTASISMLVPAR